MAIPRIRLDLINVLLLSSPLSHQKELGVSTDWTPLICAGDEEAIDGGEKAMTSEGPVDKEGHQTPR